MKFMEEPELALLSEWLTGKEIDNKVLICRIEAYTCECSDSDFQPTRFGLDFPGNVCLQQLKAHQLVNDSSCIVFGYAHCRQECG